MSTVLPVVERPALRELVGQLLDQAAAETEQLDAGLAAHWSTTACPDDPRWRVLRASRAQTAIGRALQLPEGAP